MSMFWMEKNVSLTRQVESNIYACIYIFVQTVSTSFCILVVWM